MQKIIRTSSSCDSGDWYTGKPGSLPRLLPETRVFPFIKKLDLESAGKAEEITVSTADAAPSSFCNIADASFLIHDGVLYVYDGEKTINCPLADIPREFFEDSARSFTVFDLKHCRAVLAEYGIDFAPPDRTGSIFDVSRGYVIIPEAL